MDTWRDRLVGRRCLSSHVLAPRLLQHIIHALCLPRQALASRTKYSCVRHKETLALCQFPQSVRVELHDRRRTIGFLDR